MYLSSYNTGFYNEIKFVVVFVLHRMYMEVIQFRIERI